MSSLLAIPDPRFPIHKKLPPSKGTGAKTRGTTLIACMGNTGLFLPTAGEQRLASPLTLGVRLRLLAGSGWRCGVPLNGSGGNFGWFLPGGGLSLCPAPPCRIPTAYFPPSLPFIYLNLFIIIR